MDGKIEAALTPKEWKEIAEFEATLPPTMREGPMCDYVGDAYGRRACGAWALLGYFTHEDVRRHREAAAGVRRLLAARAAESQVRAPSGQHILGMYRADQELHDRIRWHESMAERIAALLPPEERSYGKSVMEEILEEMGGPDRGGSKEKP